MSFSLSNLASWSDVEGQLTIKALLDNKLVGIPGLHVIPGVQGSIEVPYISTTPLFRGASCGGFTSGSTGLGSKNVQVCGVQMMEDLCDIELKTKVMAKFMTGNPDMPFEDTIAAEKLKQIAKFSEDLAINGNTSTTGNLSICNGLVQKLVNTSYSASTAVVTATAYTASNAITVVDSIMAATSDVVKAQEKVVILTSLANFDKYIQALRNQNWFHYTTDRENPYVLTLPGYSNVELRGISTMSGSRTIVTFPQNIIYAFNVDPNNSLQMMFNPYERKYTVFAEWYQGWEIHFPDLVTVM